jgi:peptidoglycan/xylan/chitin deacetylase (PgdA/CDA1 family)
MEAHGRVVDLDTALAERDRPGADRTFVLTFDDGYEDFHRLGYPELKKRGLPFLVYLTTHPVESGEPLTPGGRAEPLTWGQVDEMAGSGLMTLGAHTHRHPDLRALTPEQVVEELDTSNGLIRQRTGIEPAHFAYPWGYWSPSADEAVRARYATATLGGGAPVTAATDPALVNRFPVQLSDGVFFFTRRMRRGLRLEDRVRRRLTGYVGP